MKHQATTSRHTPLALRSTAAALLLSLFASAPHAVRANEPAADVELEQVVVTGTRTAKAYGESPIQTRVLTRRDIAAATAGSGGDLEDVLRQTVPGIEFTMSLSGKQHMSFAGFSGQSVLVLVDGEPLAGEVLDDPDYQRLSMTGVERIEIVKGAASALYGSAAAGGVINIITSDNPTPRSCTGEAYASVGAHSAWRYGTNADWTGGARRVRNSLRFAATKSDTYDVANGPAEQAASANYIQRYFGGKTCDISDRLTYQPSDKLRLQGRAGYYFRECLTATPAMPEHYRALSAGLRAVWSPTAADNVDIAYAFDQYDRATHHMAANQCRRTYSNVLGSVRAIYNHTFVTGDILTLGGDYTRDYLLNERTTGRTHVSHDADVFAQYDWRATAALELLTALRYDYCSEGHYSRLTPKVSARYRLSSATTLRAAYGMGFRTPTLKERYYIFNMAGLWDVVGAAVAGSDLKPELSHNVQLSAEYTAHGWNLAAAAALNVIHNRINVGLPQPVDAFPGDRYRLGTQQWLPYVNVERYTTFGIDLTATRHWPCGITARLAYAYLHETLPTTGDGQVINNQYTQSRPHALNANVSYQYRTLFNVALSTRLLSAVDNAEYTDYTTHATTTVHYPAYNITRLQATATPCTHLRITAALDNLFDYQPRYHYLNAPFTNGLTAIVSMSVLW